MAHAFRAASRPVWDVSESFIDMKPVADAQLVVGALLVVSALPLVIEARDSPGARTAAAQEAATNWRETGSL